MGKARISKDTKGNDVNIYLSMCNDCEREIQLLSSVELTDAQLDEIQSRIRCTNCLKKKLAAKK